MSKAPDITLRIRARHSGHFPLCFHWGVLYSSKGNAVYKWDDLRQPERIDTLKVPWSQRLLARSRLLERLLRFGLSHLTISPAGARMAIANRALFFSAAADHPFLPLGRLRAPVRRPMRFGFETSGADEFYIAEYFSNPFRGSVRVLRAVGGTMLEPAYTFSAGEIRHVHLVQKDPFTGRLWIATGDYGPECRIAWTEDGFKSLHTIGAGDQSWRATCLIFTREAVLWGMDSPWEQACIIRWDRDSRERDFIARVNAPVLHGAANDEGWVVLATSVEPNFQRETASTMWASRDGRSFSPVTAFEKDRWSMHFFQFGMLYFPTGMAPSNYVVFSGNAVEHCDNTMVIAELSLTLQKSLRNVWP